MDKDNLNISKESILIRINKLGSSNAKFMLSLIIYSREHKYERYTDDSGEMEHIRFDDRTAFAMIPEFADLFDNIINLINK